MDRLVCAVFAAALVAAAPFARAQAEPKYGCDAPESKQLDFWIGDWELTHEGGKSRNRISKILDGCVIFEEFTGGAGSKLDGKSYSTFDSATKKWKQTWVDNTAAYLDFDGGLVEGEMAFWRAAEKDGKKVLQRMVWRDAKADSLKWLWQRSDDGGKTWTTTWDITYRRIR